MIKKHWPVLFEILIIIIGIILGFVASNSTDTGVAILTGVILFMFLFPLAGALIGGWYGWRIRSPLKWLLAPVVYLVAVLYWFVVGLIIGSGTMDISSYWSIGSFTGIACLVVEAVASAVSWVVRKNQG